MNKFYYKFNLSWFNTTVIFPILIFSTLLSISVESWFLAWLGLEINLICFISLISDFPSNTETNIKYFIVQSFSSSLFLFSSTILLVNKLNFFVMLLNFSLLIKLGMVPFHFWYPLIMGKLKWSHCMILSTWQKISPLILISYFNIFELIIFIIILSSLASSIMGMNQTSLKKLMAFSSISHFSWILTNMLLNETNMYFYTMIYFSLTISVMNSFLNMNLSMINQTSSFLVNKSFTFNLLFSMMILSLGGMPPLMGFMPKLTTIMVLINHNYKLLIIILCLSSLLNLFFYMRIIYSMIIFFHSNSKISPYLNVISPSPSMNLMSIIPIMLLNFILIPLISYIHLY
uniref:NADH-ubiquinone oxidoreductase chain 2 n=1 Tax=Orussus occidentalis TaxID=576952 RepID=C4NCE3_ORUOC|nr:NADH dehydrogenase subunit 2 [Orussus occidentalis]ACJ69694.1 NADH dehydrogenase subunit 2 [Orussus occidentalis]